ncbi:MAG: TRAP transporter small permease [Roseovarius sp.]
MKPMRSLCRLHDVLTDASFLISTIGLALMVLIYCSEVITRYFLNYPLDWANDTFSNLLCVTIFAIVPHATRAAAHIEINLVPELVPASRRILSLVSRLAGVVVCGLVAWMSFSENLRQVAMGILTEQNHPVPVWWMASFITYGFASSTLYFLRSFLPQQVARPFSYVTPIAVHADDKVA